MKNTSVIKKSLSVVLALSMLMSFFVLFANVKVNAATDRVSMYSTGIYFSKYGMTTREIYVQTKDNASDQHVYIHYNFMDGQDWEDEEATYVTTLSDGSKIWRAYVRSYNLKYAIKYVADGQTFWDNNNGQNYTHEEIGTAPITVRRGSYPYFNNTYNIEVLLKNYAYEKNVQVRYTQDNWATYSDVPLSYNSTNSDGSELWTVNLNLDDRGTSNFQYCVYYQVNGQTYWANNFGQNYDATYYMYK